MAFLVFVVDNMEFTVMSTLSIYTPQQSLSSHYSTLAPFFVLALSRLRCTP